MLGLRPMELILIFLVILLLFGATRLPQLGSSLGSAIRNFKKGFDHGEPEEKPAGTEADKKLAQESGGAVSNDKTAEKQG